MNQENDEILKKLLKSTSEEDLLRHMRVAYDEKEAFAKWLPVHISKGYSRKEILLHPDEYTNKSEIEIKKIALEKFRQELNANI